MTQQQYEEAMAILKEDCQICADYINGEGHTCALGALALAAGVHKKHLEMAGTCGIGAAKECSCIWADHQPHVREIATAIEKRFGLTLQQQRAIQWTNDSIQMDHPAEHRRKAVAAKLGLIFSAQQ